MRLASTNSVRIKEYLSPKIRKCHRISLESKNILQSCSLQLRLRFPSQWPKYFKHSAVINRVMADKGYVLVPLAVGGTVTAPLTVSCLLLFDRGGKASPGRLRSMGCMSDILCCLLF